MNVGRVYYARLDMVEIIHEKVKQRRPHCAWRLVLGGLGKTYMDRADGSEDIKEVEARLKKVKNQPL